MSKNSDGLDIDLGFLRACLREAGNIAIQQRGQMIAEVKEDRTPVTDVDRQVEQFLIQRIHNRYPEHQILSEESGLHPGETVFTWVIDPIDGTRAFASGLPIWGVSIGILYQGESYAGGLFLPVTNELYWGTQRQAYYNEIPLPAIPLPDMENPLLFLAVPSNFHLKFTTTYPRVRSMGSTAAHLAYVVTRAAIGALVNDYSLWDIAGILPLLNAAGAQITTLSGLGFDPSKMAGGSKSSEPLVIAHPGVIDTLRAGIRAVPSPA